MQQIGPREEPPVGVVRVHRDDHVRLLVGAASDRPPGAGRIPPGPAALVLAVGRAEDRDAPATAQQGQELDQSLGTACSRDAGRVAHAIGAGRDRLQRRISPGAGRRA